MARGTRSGGFRSGTILLPHVLSSLLEPAWEVWLGDVSNIPPAAQGVPGGVEDQQSPRMGLRPRGCSTRHSVFSAALFMLSRGTNQQSLARRSPFPSLNSHQDRALYKVVVCVLCLCPVPKSLLRAGTWCHSTVQGLRPGYQPGQRGWAGAWPALPGGGIISGKSFP